MSYEVCHYANTCASQSANNKVNDFAIFIRILYRIAHRIDIQISALDDGCEAGGIVVVIELQRVVAVEHVALVPVGGLLGEAADDGVIVSGSEIVGACLLVVILPGVAEGIGVRGDRDFLVAESITASKYPLLRFIISHFCLVVNTSHPLHCKRLFIVL